MFVITGPLKICVCSLFKQITFLEMDVSVETNLLGVRVRVRVRVRLGLG